LSITVKLSEELAEVLSKMFNVSAMICNHEFRRRRHWLSTA